MILQIENGKFQYLDIPILDSVNISVDKQDKIGLIGENGAGKTTLLKILLSEILLDGGTISRQNNIQVGYLPQNASFNSDKEVFEEMKEVFSDVVEKEKQLREMELQMSNLEESTHKYQEIARKYSQISTYIESVDGYNFEYKIKKVLFGMGFVDFTQKIDTLSGGEKTRLLLSKLLLENNDLLILDEPTNHLDHDTLSFLEEYLTSYQKAVIIVSHDRYFLDKVTKKTWEITENTLFTYRGNYSKYKILKEEKYQRELLDFLSQQEEIKKLQDFVDRNIVRATSAKAAKSRQNTLERMVILTRPKKEKTPKFHFDFSFESVKDVLTVSDYVIEVADKVLAENINFLAEKGQKIAIVGKNGIGKSTFLKGIVKGFQTFEKGIVFGKNVSMSYFSQNLENLSGDKTVSEQMWDEFEKSNLKEIREHLAKMLIFSLDVDKKVSELSGGERAKLSFAIICGQKSNTLILDEPTNHLDLKSREALEKGLSEFEGTLIFVSHDRYFIENLSSKIFAITEFGGHLYDNFADYEKDVSSKRREKEEKEEKEKPKVSGVKKNLNKKDKLKITKARLEIKEIESKISEIENEITLKMEQSTLEENFKDYEKMKKITEDTEWLEKELERICQLWENLCEELEAML